jgi:hypothetical protein
MHILSSPGGRQRLCFCDELNPKFTTGEKHEDYSEDYVSNSNSWLLCVGAIGRRHGASTGLLAQASLLIEVTLFTVSGWFKLATHRYAQS